MPGRCRLSLSVLVLTPELETVSVLLALAYNIRVRLYEHLFCLDPAKRDETKTCGIDNLLTTNQQQLHVA